MQKFKPSVKTLKETLSVQTHSHDYGRIMEFIINNVKDMKGVTWSKDKHDNFYITKGRIKPSESYPCVVAHHDTVHRVVKGDYRIHTSSGWLYAFDHSDMKQLGTGGDDLVGVWCALELLRHHDVIKVALFSQEEIGCVGSGKADMKFFKNVGYVFQTDRKGNSDFVNQIGQVKLSSDEFIAEIQPVLDDHKYTVTTGGLTDVKTLTTKGIGVCTANMSSGYYRPHTDTEVVCIKDAKNVCRMMHNMITKLGYTKWEMEYVEPTYNTYSNYGGWGNSWNSYGGYGATRTVYPQKSYSNFWSKSQGSSHKPVKTKTDKKQDELAWFIFYNENIIDASAKKINSFIDTLKFVCKARNMHPLDVLEKAVDSANIVKSSVANTKSIPKKTSKLYDEHRVISLENSLNIYCELCYHDELEPVDYYNGRLDGTIYCPNCNTELDIYDMLFASMKEAKSREKREKITTQLSLPMTDTTNDKTDK